MAWNDRTTTRLVETVVERVVRRSLAAYRPVRLGKVTHVIDTKTVVVSSKQMNTGTFETYAIGDRVAYSGGRDPIVIRKL